MTKVKDKERDLNARNNMASFYAMIKKLILNLNKTIVSIGVYYIIGGKASKFAFGPENDLVEIAETFGVGLGELEKYVYICY